MVGSLCLNLARFFAKSMELLCNFPMLQLLRISIFGPFATWRRGDVARGDSSSSPPLSKLPKGLIERSLRFKPRSSLRRNLKRGN